MTILSRFVEERSISCTHREVVKTWFQHFLRFSRVHLFFVIYFLSMKSHDQGLNTSDAESSKGIIRNNLFGICSISMTYSYQQKLRSRIFGLVFDAEIDGQQKHYMRTWWEIISGMVFLFFSDNR